MTALSRSAWVGASLLALLATAACAGDTGTGTESDPSAANDVRIKNCSTEASFPSPAERVYVYDGGMISMLLSIGAAKSIAGMAGLNDDRQVMERAYGKELVDSIPVATEDQPNLENVIATRPDLVVAGWNYGWNEDENFTPDGLSERDIAGYTLTESCRQGDGDTRGIVPPWDALRTDLTNLGRITGHENQAKTVIDDIDQRLQTLQAAPQADDKPTVFLFDSGTDAPFTSGSFGGPQAIIDAAGARNATEDLEDTWTTVSWERVVASQPDYIAMVDYPGQTFEAKIKVLQTNPSTKDLPAVKEGRFLNLPYAAWVSGPLNIDAAEQLRSSLEDERLVPATSIAPTVDLVP